MSCVLVTIKMSGARASRTQLVSCKVATHHIILNTCKQPADRYTNIRMSIGRISVRKEHEGICFLKFQGQGLP